MPHWVSRGVLSALLVLALAPPGGAQPRPSVVPPSPTPFTLRLVLADTGQALIYDLNRKEYLLVRRGQKVRGFSIVRVAGDRVVFSSRGQELVVLADSTPLIPGRPVPDPIDPYDSTREAATMDSTGAPAESPSFLQPEEGVAAAGIIVRETWIDRKDVDSLLANFDKLRRDVSVAVTGSGKLWVQRITRGSYVHRLGIRQGDLIGAIAGVNVRSLDDAAVVYSRVLRRDDFRVELERGGEPWILAFRFSPP